MLYISFRSRIEQQSRENESYHSFLKTINSSLSSIFSKQSSGSSVAEVIGCVEQSSESE